MSTPEDFMNLALNLAKKHNGLTGSNPSVGCVVTKHGKIIATGITDYFGNPHAEFMAFSGNENFKGAEVYVTLEPCNHYGNTPPCTKKIINAGTSKVYVGIEDPDIRVNSGGIKALTESNIKVETGILESKIKEFYKPYIKARTKNIPFVTIKTVCSLDGKIATHTGDSKWIDSEKSRLYTNFLRSRYNGILVGAETFKQDSPRLTCRIEGLEQFSSIKFLYSNSIKHVEGFEIVKGSEIEVLKKIYKMGVNHLLIEGGSKIINSFLEKDLADEIILIQAPIFIGKGGKSAISLEDINVLTEAKKYKLKTSFTVDEIIFNILQK